MHPRNQFFANTRQLLLTSGKVHKEADAALCEKEPDVFGVFPIPEDRLPDETGKIS
jgi:hypothetical protein